MFDCVPEPVCQTTSGKCSSSLPSITSRAAAAMAAATSGVQQALLEIGLGGGELHPRQRMDDLDRHAADADGEILPRPLRLRAPIGGGRNLYVAEGITLDSEFGRLFGHGSIGLARGKILTLELPYGAFRPVYQSLPARGRIDCSPMK